MRRESLARNLSIASAATLAGGGDPRLAALFGAASIAIGGPSNPWNLDQWVRSRVVEPVRQQLGTPTTVDPIDTGTPYTNPYANPGGAPVGMIPFASVLSGGSPHARFLSAKRAGRRGGKKSAAKRKAKAKSARRTTKRRSTKRPARLVKGSLAAKRYMAALRNKRK